MHHPSHGPSVVVVVLEVLQFISQSTELHEGGLSAGFLHGVTITEPQSASEPPDGGLQQLHKQFV